MWYKHSFGFYELFWQSEKWMALYQVIRGKGIKFGSRNMLYVFRIFNEIFCIIRSSFSCKSWYFMSRNQCCDVQNDIKQSWNVPLTILFDSGSSGNLKIIPILAGLMIALTSLFNANSKHSKQITSKVTINTPSQVLMQQSITIPSTSFWDVQTLV